MDNHSESQDANVHIRQYLKYYLELPKSPNYAVLLDGKWGIGKTYLVKEYLHEYFSDKNSYAYVSLYGISNIRDLNAAIITALYPMLGWKITKVGGQLAQSVLEMFNFKIDLKPQDVLNKLKVNVFVFDDIERCKLSIEESMGYINRFVEHDGCKVILVANQSEILNDENYLRIKEKVIGKTLEVQSVIESALHNFIADIKDKEIKNLYKENSESILSIYRQSMLDNLRILQQTMWDYERFYAVLDSEQKKNKDAMECLLKLIFVLSFEIKTGNLVKEDLNERMSALIGPLHKRDQGQELTKMQLVSEKYPEINVANTILSDELLIDILIKGVINAHAIRDSLNKSQYYVSVADEPAWRTVWFGFEREDKEFYSALKTLGNQIKNRIIETPGIIIHSFGLYLWLSNAGIINKSRKDILNEAIKYIDDLYKTNRLAEELPNRADDYVLDGYDRLQFHEASTEELKKIIKYLSARRKQVFVDGYPSIGSQLLQDMKNDTALFFRELCMTNSEDNLYYRIPVLAVVDVGQFVSIFLALHPSLQRTVMKVFKTRYEYAGFAKELIDEKSWLISLKDTLNHEILKKSKFAKYRIQKLIESTIDQTLNSKVLDGGKS